jgi:hypothetical protein
MYPLWFSVLFQTKEREQKVQMKTIMSFASLALVSLMVAGCASSNKGGDNPVAKWQTNRFKASEIKSLEGSKNLPAVADVTYKSTLKQPSLAATINAFAVIPAGLYVQVVNGVDEMDASQNGRKLFQAVQNDVSAGKKYNTVIDALSSEEKTAYDTYAKYIANKDQTSIIATIQQMLTAIANEATKVAPLVQSVKANPEFTKLAGMELMMANKNLVADGDALKQQFDDATSGANLWLKLVQEDKAAKEYMKNYK